MDIQAGMIFLFSFLLPLFQIIGGFCFSKYITFATYIQTKYYISKCIAKNYVCKKARSLIIYLQDGVLHISSLYLYLYLYISIITRTKKMTHYSIHPSLCERLRVPLQSLTWHCVHRPPPAPPLRHHLGNKTEQNQQLQFWHNPTKNRTNDIGPL